MVMEMRQGEIAPAEEFAITREECVNASQGSMERPATSRPSIFNFNGRYIKIHAIQFNAWAIKILVSFGIEGQSTSSRCENSICQLPGPASLGYKIIS
jgi:hypothetical protein